MEKRHRKLKHFATWNKIRERMKEKLGSLCRTIAVAVRSAEEKRKTPWMNYCTTLKRTVRLEVRSTIERAWRRKHEAKRKKTGGSIGNMLLKKRLAGAGHTLVQKNAFE